MQQSNKTVAENATKKWNGGDLPPVGAVCEITYDNGITERCEIIAYGADKVWFCAQYDMLRGLEEVVFHPIKTAREKNIDELVEVISSIQCGGPRMLAEALHDAGYRKEAEEC